ncbi:PRELI domain-containing protein 1, mitochondrial-like isoform X1 [Oscarella lobularis]|uniref:PRELI domain-containing protein 1, mitochondrial-like isoform X1 n=1 Tax=Oscarella lobularis TaxID=121494 RepID=UPI0033134C62
MASFQGKFYSSVHTVKNRWDQVTTALWKRYPNPMAKHVLWEDTISRELDDGKLKSKRLFGKTNRLPQWGKRFVSGSTTEAVVLEESIVDPDEETFVTYTRNLNMTRIMSVEEKCTYYPNPENKEWTCCKRQVWINSNVYGFSKALQAFGLMRFKDNIKKAQKGLEYVIEKMNEGTPNAPQVLPSVVGSSVRKTMPTV